MADTGNTSAVTISGWSGTVIRFQCPEFTREALEDTDIATSNQKTFVPDDLYDPGELEIEFFWDQSATNFPPIGGAAESVSLAFPLKSGEVTNATLAGTAFVVSSTGPEVVNGSLMRGTMRWKFDGKTEVAYTAGGA